MIENSSRPAWPVLLALAVHAIHGSGAAQEEIEPRRLTSLLRALRTGDDAAAEALVRVGRPAVGELMRIAREEKPPARFRAIEVVGRMGPEASDAVPELLEIAAGLGGTELPILIRAIGNLHPYRSTDVPDLEARVTQLALTSYAAASGEVRRSVLITTDRSMARMGLDAGAALEELVAALESHDSYVRELAAELLGRRGADAAPALRALDEAAASFYHPDVPLEGDRVAGFSAEVQLSAANAVLAIGGDASMVARAHAIRVRVGGPTERLLSARELAKMAPDFCGDAVVCSEVVYHLAEAIVGNRSSPVALEAVITLGEIGRRLEDWTAARYWATTAIPLLQELARGRDGEIAGRARMALERR